MNRLTILLFIAVVFSITNNTVQAQTQKFIWAQSSGGTSNDRGLGVATDGSGKIITTGWFQNSATFGNSTIISFGSNDIYITKSDANGTIIWVKQAGGVGDDRGEYAKIDGDDNIIITGWFEGTVTFDDTTIIASDSSNIYVAKYNTNGDLLWVRHAGGTGAGFSLSVAVDNENNIIITGYFRGSITFGNITLTSLSTTEDVFIAKYDPFGNVLWAHRAGGIDNDRAYGVETDPNENIIITGSFGGTAIFGGKILLSVGAQDIFIVKYDSSGNVVWAKQAGGIALEGDKAFGISIDSNGNNFITGSFHDAATFNNITLTGIGQEIFVAKYDTSGNVLWAEEAGGSEGSDLGRDISIDNNNFVLITGWFTGIASFSDTMLTSAGLHDIFIAKYSNEGNLMWVSKAGGTDYDRGAAITTDNSGNVIAAGFFQDMAVFGDTTLSSTGLEEIFITKIDAGGSTGIEKNRNAIPYDYTLSQNYPNPFNPSTSIQYAVSNRQFVTLKIYDVLGNEVATLVNEEKQVGSYEVKYNAANLPSGIYFYKLQAGSFIETKKMVLLR